MEATSVKQLAGSSKREAAFLRCGVQVVLLDVMTIADEEESQLKQALLGVMETGAAKSADSRRIHLSEMELHSCELERNILNLK